MPYELLPMRRRSLLSELSPEDDTESFMFSDPRRWGGQGYDAADLELKPRSVTPQPQDRPFEATAPSMGSMGSPSRADDSPLVARAAGARAPSLLDVLPAGDGPTEPAMPDMPMWAARQAMQQGDPSRAPIPGNAARIIAGLDAEKNANLETMRGQMADRGRAASAAIQPGMGMAESGAASEAARQEMTAQQQIAGGMPWWQAQGNQTTFYSGNKPSTSNDEFLAQFGGGFKQSGRGPGGGAVEQVMPAAKPLTLIDALAPGESNQVKDHMGRVMWAKNDKALPRDPNEPKWSPGLTPVNGPNSPEAMGRYEAAMQAQRERQAARGFDPNKNNGANTGLAQARALARNGMDPNMALATARENVGNPIATNSLLAGVMMGPELLQEHVRADGLMKAAEFRAKEFATQAELARQQGNNQLALQLEQLRNNAAADANRTALLVKQLEAQAAQAAASNKLKETEITQQGAIENRKIGVLEKESAQRIEDKNKTTPTGMIDEATKTKQAERESSLVPWDPQQGLLSVDEFNQTGEFDDKFVLNEVLPALQSIEGGRLTDGANVGGQGAFMNNASKLAAVLRARYPAIDAAKVGEWYAKKRTFTRPAPTTDGW
jgi:hypothetical protein